MKAGFLMMDSVQDICHTVNTLWQTVATCKEKVSRVVRKPDFCICENKDTDQLRGDCEADQRLCFRLTDSTIPLLSTSEISSL